MSPTNCSNSVLWTIIKFPFYARVKLQAFQSETHLQKWMVDYKSGRNLHGYHVQIDMFSFTPDKILGDENTCDKWRQCDVKPKKSVSKLVTNHDTNLKICYLLFRIHSETFWCYQVDSVVSQQSTEVINRLGKLQKREQYFKRRYSGRKQLKSFFARINKK